MNGNDQFCYMCCIYRSNAAVTLFTQMLLFLIFHIDVLHIKRCFRI
jgi:hypothetical protein